MIGRTPLDKLQLWGVTLNGVYQPGVFSSDPQYDFAYLTVGAHKLPLDDDYSVSGSIPPFPLQAEQLLQHAVEFENVRKGSLLATYTHLIQVPDAPPLPFTPEELDAEHQQGKGWRDYAVLSGYHQSYGCVWLDGWPLPVARGAVWHIGQVFHNSIITDRNAPFTVTLQVRPFAVFERNGRAVDPVEITATCADLQQRHSTVPQFDGVGPLSDELVVTLHSIKPDGRQALLALYASTAGASLADCPVGWLLLDITGDEPGSMAATLTVHKSREATLGDYTEVPLGPELAGDALVVFATTTFTQTEVAPGRFDVTCTFSGPAAPPTPPITSVHEREYSSENIGRLINLAFRPDGSIAELTCDVTWQGYVTQSWSDLTASGSIEGEYRVDDGGNIFGGGIVDIGANVSGESLVTGEMKFKAGGVVVDHIEYRSLITRNSRITTADRSILGGGSTDPNGPLGRYFNLPISVNGSAFSTNIVTGTTEWETTLKVNGVTVDSNVRSAPAVRGLNPPLGTTLTRPQSVSFAVREIYNKNSSGLGVNDQAWAVDARPQTNHSAHIRWGNCSETGAVQINDTAIASISIADRHPNPTPAPSIYQLRDFAAHYDPKAEDLVPSDVRPSLPDNPVAMRLYYL
ncbi:hypothetical protein [Pseudomonas xionganensis]|uniref:Uncharacterized protein n=1 Tax=Pseudomonas xionganensis TaxID=2654845 RepID=A0A6I4KRT8_9PSED|nr:hypothetical protein [Pseudomonas xionganensis]MVW75399.1 hypothetical protein [Pseudomonas xionganensis]